MATKKPLGDLVARLTAAGRALTSNDSRVWMSPGEAPKPITDTPPTGRQLDFAVSTNTQIQPRAYEALTFAQLRGLAESYDLLRLAVETRKDQMVKLAWSIKPKDEKAEVDSRCEELEKFFMMPDQENDWDSWLRMLLEDLLVIDAPTLYVRKNNGDKVFALEPVDGALIKRILDDTGRTPIAPLPAYQQIMKGVTAVEYTTEELIYRPRNKRTHKMYGYSPVEQVVTTVNIALRRQVSQLQYYTEGNIPEAIIGLPDTWTPDQVKKFQQYWDGIHEGNTAMRRHARFISGDVKIQFTKDPMLKDEFDEWLARVICYAFSLPPTAFIKQMNRATAENATDMALEEGLAPMMQWVRGLINSIIVKYWGYTDLEFTWSDIRDTDPLQQAQINQIYVTTGIKTVDEVRAELGMEPMSDEDKAEANGVTPNPDGSLPDPNKPDPAKDPANPDQAAQNELDNSVKLDKKKKNAPIRNVALMASTKRKLRGKVTKFIKKQKPTIIDQVTAAYDKLGKADDDGSADDIVNGIDLSSWGDLAPSVQAALLKVASDSGETAVITFGLDADNPDITSLVNEGASDFARDRGAELVGKKWIDGELVDNPNAKWSITDSTRELLRSDIQDAINSGVSTAELADTLSDNYAFSEERADVIARTELARAHVEGQMLAYNEAGVTAKQWILSADPCSICEENAAAGVIDFNDDFPSGDDAPPAHPNCTCDVVPILAPVNNSTDDDTTEE